MNGIVSLLLRHILNILIKKEHIFTLDLVCGAVLDYMSAFFF